MASNEIEVVKAFIKAINEGNITELSKLMTEDHMFVDAGGRKERGRRKMTSGWKAYFQMFPDFRIETDEFFQSGNRVAFFGSTSATYNGKRGLVPKNRVGGPAAWRATVENGKIKTWQVYADWTEDMKTIEADKMYLPEEEILSIIRQINQYWLKKQYDNIGELVSENVVIVPPGFDKRVQGRKAYIQSYRDYDQHAKTKEFSPGEPEIDITGDTAVAISPFYIVYELDGKTYREKGHELLVLSHDSGQWQVIWRTLFTKTAD